MRTNPARLLLGVVIAVTAISAAWGFDYIDNTRTGLPVKWPPGTIPMRILVDNSTVLNDGNTRATSISGAMQSWNQVLGDAQFSWQFFPAGTGTDGNSGGGNRSEVFF